MGYRDKLPPKPLVQFYAAAPVHILSAVDTRRLLTFGDTDNSEEYISVGAGRVGIEKYNEALMRICENLSVECIDTSSMHGDERFFYDDFHFNEAGAAELARIIADHVVREAGPNSWTRVP